MLGLLLTAVIAATLLPSWFRPEGLLLFAGIPCLLLVRSFGARWGLVGALLGCATQLALGRIPWLVLPLLVEPLVVGTLLRRGMGSLLLADLLYWFLFGLPLWILTLVLAGFSVFRLPLELLWLPVLMGAVNALLAALVCRWGAIHRRQPNLRSPLLESQLNRVMAAFLSAPLWVGGLRFLQEGSLGDLSFGGPHHQLSQSFPPITASPTALLLAFLVPSALATLLVWQKGRHFDRALNEVLVVTGDLPSKLGTGEQPDWPKPATTELDTLVRNVRGLTQQLEQGWTELQEMKISLFETRDHFQARKNWETYQSSKLLSLEREERLRAVSLLQKLEAAEAKYRFLVERSLVGIFIARGQHIVYANPRFGEMFGYPAEYFQRRIRLADLAHLEDQVLLEGHLRKQVAGQGGSAQFSFRGIRQGGQTIHLEMLTGLTSHAGELALIGTLIDVSKRKQAEATLQHLATHDPLTDLPNRTLFQDRLEQTLSLASRSGTMVGVLFIDLDRFKGVNDSLGHAAGDGILRAMAERLLKCVRESDTVSRFGGDEFNLLLPQVRGEKDVIKVAEKILLCQQQPFVIDDQEFSLTCSIGIALSPRDGQEAHDLLRNADTALYRAKEMGRNTYQVFHAAMNIQAIERMEIEHSLRRVLERKELRVFYQPQMNLATEQVVGMEALLRWEHGEGKFIAPSTFIPVAEETGLILPIGEWVLRTGCRQVKRWSGQGASSLRLGINVSASQFQEEDFLKLLEQVLLETDMDPRKLNLELTETVVIQNVRQSIERLRHLHDIGITVAIDDFGVGYSSLSYLKDFPVDQLKLDRSFVCNLPGGETERQIARHIIDMAHDLGLKVIAEGIESSDQLAFLREIGCDEAQGFWLSPPLPAEEFLELVLQPPAPWRPATSPLPCSTLSA